MCPVTGVDTLTSLVWDQGVYLRIRVTVVGVGDGLGYLVVEVFGCGLACLVNILCFMISRVKKTLGYVMAYTLGHVGIL